jgi:hypothetical protein
MQNHSIARNKSTGNGVAGPNGRTTSRISTSHKAAIAGLLLLPLMTGPVLAAATGPVAEAVSKANERFADVAVAKAEGYAPIPCTSGIDGGAMGIHYVNASLIDDKVDIAHPEAVMYEPGPDGKLTLVGVEYIANKGPAALGGQLFSFTNAPNRYGLPAFYELHVWAWKENAKGVFADMNPDVSCAMAPMEGM